MMFDFDFLSKIGKQFQQLDPVPNTDPDWDPATQMNSTGTVYGILYRLNMR